MNKFLLTFLSLIIFGMVRADFVDSDQAALVAKNHFWQVSQITNYDNLDPVLVYTDESDGSASWYVFQFAGSEGFIIIAADDDVYPVLGYSFDKSFTGSMDSQPDNFLAWMDVYSQQIKYVRDHQLKADEAIASTWASLQEYSPKQSKLLNVDPLVNTEWDQGCFYNEYCPDDDDGPCNHVYVGCVATCMAQIMKFHAHPAQGTGSNSYYAYPYGQLSVDFGAATYNWSAMPSELFNNNDQVATISYHCGVAVNMQYSASGSGAYSNSARNAFVDHFGYSDDAVLHTKAAYSNSAWESMIRNDLNGGFPLYYAGYGSGGHAFVLDGYQGTNHFHFNWGWSGWYNGYFYLSNLNPGGSNFTDNQEAIFHIYPEGTVTLAAPENLEYQVIGGNSVELTWDEPAAKALTGYNIYRNNNLIDNTSENTYSDTGLESGTYEYYVTAVYDEGESVPSSSVSVLITGGSNMVFDDDFSAYNTSEQLVCQSAAGWTTWSNNPCSAEDPFVTDDQAYSGNNSIVVEGTNDLVKVVENYTTGFYKISFYIYVPSGYLGYFNTLQEFNGTNSLWGMQVYFDEGGAGSIDAGSTAAATFNFANDTWILNEIIIDLNNDWAEYKVDGNSIHSWVWSVGAFGQNNNNQLGGSNFYAWTGSKGTPKFYIDDYSIEDIGGTFLPAPANLTYTLVEDDVLLDWDAPETKDILGYNVYYSFESGAYEMIAFIDETAYTATSPGQGLHNFYVTAVYNDGESGPSNTVSFLITDIEEQSADQLLIYPNPVSDVIYLNSEELIKSVSVYNYDGRLMLSHEVGKKQSEVQVSDLHSGIYLIRVETENNTITQRIIIR